VLYLYGVNKQIGYITSAHLILLSVAASYFFISKISSVSNYQGPEIAYNASVKNTVVLSEKAAKGKTLFISNCAVCHDVFKDRSAPALAGFETRGPWADRKELYKWVRNPAGFMENDPYTKGLKEKFGQIMSPFPNLTDGEIDAIADYISAEEKQKTIS